MTPLTMFDSLLYANLCKNRYVQLIRKYTENIHLWRMFAHRPNDVQHHLSVASLMGVLQRANQRKKLTREDRSMERSDKKGGDGQDMSRSNSVQSTAASSFALTQQLTTLNAQRKSSDKVRKGCDFNATLMLILQ